MGFTDGVSPFRAESQRIGIKPQICHLLYYFGQLPKCSQNFSYLIYKMGITIFFSYFRAIVRIRLERVKHKPQNMAQ